MNCKQIQMVKKSSLFSSYAPLPPKILFLQCVFSDCREKEGGGREKQCEREIPSIIKINIF